MAARGENSVALDRLISSSVEAFGILQGVTAGRFLANILTLSAQGDAPLQCNCWMLQARVSSSMGKCVLCVRRLLLMGCSLAFGASATGRARTLVQGFGPNPGSSERGGVRYAPFSRDQKSERQDCSGSTSKVPSTSNALLFVRRCERRLAMSPVILENQSLKSDRTTRCKRNGGVRWPGERNTEYASRRNVVSLLTDQWAMRS